MELDLSRAEANLRRVRMTTSRQEPMLLDDKRLCSEGDPTSQTWTCI